MTAQPTASNPDTHVAPAGVSRTDPAPRLGIIQTDRPCAACGFNLHGQTLVREPHYNLVIARCPECGAAAALQEYPALGKWANRWAALLAALFLLVAIALSLLAALFIGVGCYAVTESFATPMAVRIGQDFVAHQKEVVAQSTAAGAAPQPNVQIDPNPGFYTWGDMPWWNAQDHDAIFRRSGGLKAALAPRQLIDLLLLVLITLPLGVVLACACAGLKPRAMLFYAFFPVGLAFIGLAFQLHTPPSMLGGWFYAGDAAVRHIFWQVIWLPLAVSYLSLAAWMLLGRKIGRLAIRILLPPRQRVALAILWHADGLELPRPTPGSSRPHPSRDTL